MLVSRPERRFWFTKFWFWMETITSLLISIFNVCFYYWRNCNSHINFQKSKFLMNWLTNLRVEKRVDLIKWTSREFVVQIQTYQMYKIAKLYIEQLYSRLGLWMHSNWICVESAAPIPKTFSWNRLPILNQIKSIWNSIID